MTALNSFKSQYNAYPGDIKNFSSYYSSCVDDSNTLYNGNGDGKIDSIQSSTYKENVRVCQHLTLAGLYLGNFNGSTSSTGGYGIDINNTPFSPLNGGSKLAYSFWRWSSGTPSTTGFLQSNSSGFMILGRPHSAFDGNQA